MYVTNLLETEGQTFGQKIHAHLAQVRGLQAGGSGPGAPGRGLQARGSRPGAGPGALGQGLWARGSGPGAPGRARARLNGTHLAKILKQRGWEAFKSLFFIDFDGDFS